MLFGWKASKNENFDTQAASFLELQGLGLGLELSLGVGLGAGKLLIADSRYAIHGNQVPVAGTGRIHDLKYGL